MRLIDVDALKKDLGMADRCEDCPTDAKLCADEYMYSKRDICEWLDNAPTAQQWIPCSERLPEDDDYYYVTRHNGEVKLGWYDDINAKWYTYEPDGNTGYDNERKDIIAWQPHPEPFKEVQDEIH